LYLQTSEAIWLYTLQYHIIIYFTNSADRYLFRKLCLRWHSVHHLLLQSESAIM